LRDAEIAHGDLQHGNIIVEHGHLRLVDHDGLFVPEMAGWTSSEVGHQHYQHPARDAAFFNKHLDNFSAIVIYLFHSLNGPVFGRNTTTRIFFSRRRIS
jgi:hypothetical protein